MSTRTKSDEVPLVVRVDIYPKATVHGYARWFLFWIVVVAKSWRRWLCVQKKMFLHAPGAGGCSYGGCFPYAQAADDDILLQIPVARLQLLFEAVGAVDDLANA